MLPFLRGLVDAGLNVTVFQSTSGEKPMDMDGLRANIIHLQLPNIKALKTDAATAKFSRMRWTHQLHGYRISEVYALSAHFMEEFMDRRADKLVEVLNGDWDLVVFDSLFNCHSYAIAQMLHRKGVPYVIFGTTFWLKNEVHRLAFGQSWAPNPSLFTPIPTGNNDVYDPTSFTERLVNTIEYASEVGAMRLGDAYTLEPAAMRLGPPDFTMDRMFHEAAFTIHDGIDRLSWPVAEAPDSISVGVHCDTDTVTPLGEEYASFIEDQASKGTIYIALGSIANWTTAPDHIRNAMFDAINELSEYRIIFSYKGPMPPNVPAHAKLVEWAPQLAILAHPKTKAFLTHAGLKSFREGLCTETPMVFMPIWAEQAHNSKLGLRLGIGAAVNKFQASKEVIVSALREVMEHRKYAERIAKVKDIYLDRIIPSPF
ncbi:CRE-UGT-63 protein [Aphelenchoides avenae]|nr:CRE-UGT-63 protein [Aphelenchus avenae]